MLANSIITQNDYLALFTVAGEAANKTASNKIFDEYRKYKATNTQKRQQDILMLFTYFLSEEIHLPVDDLANDPAAWVGITWGLVETFKNYLLQRGYAIATINLALSVIKVYSRLATKAGALARKNGDLIRLVQGISHREGKRIDEQRKAAAVPTRVSC